MEFLPNTQYNTTSTLEPVGLEIFRSRIHISYPAERTDERFTVYANCGGSCLEYDHWTRITKLNGRDHDTLWVYLDASFQNDNGLYQFRGWEDENLEGQQITYRWKADQ